MKSFLKRSVIGMVVLGMAGSTYAAMSHDTHNNHNHNHHANGNDNGGGYVRGGGYANGGYVNGGGYGNGCCDGNYYNSYMWMPHFTGFFVGVEGLDLRPQNGDLDFVNAGASNLFIVTTPFITSSVTTSYDWDWRVYAGLTFSDCDDLTFSWFHLDTSDHKTFVSGFDQPLFVRWLFFDTDFDTDGVRARVKFDVDEAYLVWGHTIKFNNPWTLRFAGGVEYAKIDSDLTISAASTIDEETGFFASNRGNSHLRGWGPRVELDASYHFPCTSLSWFAKSNAALLSSRRRISLESFDNDPDTFPNVFGASWTNRHIVIPKFGLKIGIAYSWMWGQMGGEGCGGCGNTYFTLEAGWQADAYIHAIERPEHGFNNFNEDQEFLFANTKTSNFTDQGWFVGIKVGMGWL